MKETLTVTPTESLRNGSRNVATEVVVLTAIAATAYCIGKYGTRAVLRLTRRHKPEVVSV